MAARFQKMWEAHEMGALSGELTALLFSNDNLITRSAGVIEKNIIFFSRRGGGTQFYYRTDEMQQAAGSGLKRFTDGNKTQGYLDACGAAIKAADDVYDEFCSIDLDGLSLKELLSLFSKLRKGYEEVYGLYPACQPQYFWKIEERVRSALPEDVYAGLTMPDRPDPVVQEEIDWLKIVMRINKDPGSAEMLLKAHSQRYIFLGTVETNSPWDVDHYRKLLDASEDPGAELAAIEDRYRRIKGEIAALKGSVDAGMFRLCRTLADLAVNRMELRFGWT